MEFKSARKAREDRGFAKLSTWAPVPQYHGDETPDLFDIP
jgi:hypothetical protein